eukprot:3643471-Prymnesium_polylepis.2
MQRAARVTTHSALHRGRHRGHLTFGRYETALSTRASGEKREAERGSALLEHLECRSRDECDKLVPSTKTQNVPSKHSMAV